MSILPILEWPHPVLETPAKPVETFDDTVKKHVEDMCDTMNDANGIGLAANQVGILQRIIVIEIPFEGSRYEEDEEEPQWWHNKKFVLINPIITKKEGKIRYQEGCLSFPEIFENVDRAAVVEVEAFDENGKKSTFTADGLFSVCIQHEIDHIDGIVFIDRMSRLKSSRTKKKILRRQSPQSALQTPMD